MLQFIAIPASFHVCYTKLLEVFAVGELTEEGGEARRRMNVFGTKKNV